jgi:hypothetical protein
VKREDSSRPSFSFPAVTLTSKGAQEKEKKKEKKKRKEEKKKRKKKGKKKEIYVVVDWLCRVRLGFCSLTSLKEIIRCQLDDSVRGGNAAICTR